MNQATSIKLNPLEPDRYEALKPYYDHYNSDIHDLNLTNLIIWRKKYDLHTLELGSYLWIVYGPNDPFGTFFSEPIGDYEDLSALKNATMLWWQYCLENGFTPKLRHVGASFLSLIKSLDLPFHALPVENDFDYCYLSEKLATLSGNAYHKKKNHLNQFHRLYEQHYRIEPITTSNAHAALVAAKEWCVANGCGTSLDLCYELQGINEILTDWETHVKHGLEGVLIFIDDHPVAVTFGEYIVNETFLVHVEKADQNVQGIYTAINQAMAYRVFERCKYINREQDLGLEGLRKAKLSYHPHHLVEKFDIQFSIA